MILQVCFLQNYINSIQIEINLFLENTFKVSNKGKVIVIPTEEGKENKIAYHPSEEKNTLTIPITDQKNKNVIKLDLKNDVETRLQLKYNEFVDLADLYVDSGKTVTFDLLKLERDISNIKTVDLTVLTTGFSTLQVSQLQFSKSTFEPDKNKVTFLRNWKQIADLKDEWSDDLVINKNDEKVIIDKKQITFEGKKI